MKNLEEILLNYVRKKDIFDKLAQFIEDDFLSEEGREVYSGIKELIKKCNPGEMVKASDILIFLTSDNSKSDEEVKELREYIVRIRKSKVTNDEILLEVFKEYYEKITWKKSLELFMPYLNKKGELPVDEVEKAIENTKRLREVVSGSKGYDYSEHTGTRSNIRDSPGRVESPLEGVYLYPGEVGLWVGRPKGGKSWALVNSGYKALVQGKRVLHYSIDNLSAEWVALRYDSRILKRSMDEVKVEDSLKAVKKMRLFGGFLMIKDPPELTLGEVRDYLKSNRYDVVIIDYPDMLLPPRRYKERRQELLGIYQGVRSIAKEFRVPIWCASQSTAEGFKHGHNVLGLGDLEESKIGKGGTCSLILTINQTEEERDDGIARIYIAGSNRGYRGRSIRKVECDFSSMLMEEIKHKSKEEEDNEDLQ